MTGTIESIKKFAESKTGQIVLGFALTTLLGTTINHLYQKSTWERERKFEILKRSLDKHESIVNDLSELVSSRAFRLERVIWALENYILEQRSITEEELNEVEERWREYYSKVIDWSEKFRVQFSRLRYAAGKEMAHSFYLGEDESTKNDVSSVYGFMRSAHIATLKLYRCSKKERCENAIELLKDAKLKRDNLYAKIDEFLFELHLSLDKRFYEIRELR